MTRRHIASRRVDWYDRASFFAVSVLAIWLYMQGQFHEYGSFDFNMGAHLHYGILFIGGVALGARRPWFPWVHIAVAFLLSEAPAVLSAWAVPNEGIHIGFSNMLTLVFDTKSQLLAIVLGALVLPVGGYLRRRPLRNSRPAAASSQ